MSDLPLNALRAFSAVVSEGGIRAAARKLGVAHSAVSRHVAELEAFVGRPLLQRRQLGHEPNLTAAGEQIARAAAISFELVETALARVSESRSASTVVLSTTASIGARWLLPRLPRLRKAHPRLQLSVRVDSALVDPTTGMTDIALRMGRGPWPGVSAEPLMDDALAPVVSPAFWHEHGKPKTLKALLKLPLIHDRDPNAAWDTWRDQVGPRDLDCGSGPRFESSDLVLRAAAQGEGVALARIRLAGDDLSSGALIRPFGPYEVRLPNAYWIVTSGQHDRAAVKTVVEWLKREATQS
jgi:LysR family glycine cleavage system transcriptional activator